MSETARPTPPRTAAQVSPILKRVESTGSEPVIATSPGCGGRRPPKSSRMPMTSSNAVAMDEFLPERGHIMPRRSAQVHVGLRRLARHSQCRYARCRGRGAELRPDDEMADRRRDGYE